MPLYEYRCAACAKRFEVLQRLGENGGGLACPHCSAGEPVKQLSTFAATSSGPGARTDSQAGPAGGCGTGCGCASAN